MADEPPVWSVTVFISGNTKELNAYLNSVKWNTTVSKPLHMFHDLALHSLLTCSSSCHTVPHTVVRLWDDWPAPSFSHIQCSRLWLSGPYQPLSSLSLTPQDTGQTSTPTIHRLFWTLCWASCLSSLVLELHEYNVSYIGLCTWSLPGDCQLHEDQTVAHSSEFDSWHGACAWYVVNVWPILLNCGAWNSEHVSSLLSTYHLHPTVLSQKSLNTPLPYDHKPSILGTSLRELRLTGKDQDQQHTLSLLLFSPLSHLLLLTSCPHPLSLR